MKLIAISLLLLCISCNTFASPDCVILLHGLGRSHYSMGVIKIELKKANYIVVNESYPSTSQSIEDIAEESLPPMITACMRYHPDTINVVTHSMGGIVLREYLAHHDIPKLSRIVMLAPPNHGSPLADWLHDNFLFKWIAGPAGQELGANKYSVPNTLPTSLPYQLGVIAGDDGILPYTSQFFKNDNDGVVSVTSAQLDGVQDFIVLPVSHSFMMYNDDVIDQVLWFLEVGHFDHAKKDDKEV